MVAENPATTSTTTNHRGLSTQASSLQAEETLATSPTEDLLYQHPAQALLEG